LMIEVEDLVWVGDVIGVMVFIENFLPSSLRKSSLELQLL
jgi:hypothetical protein